MNQHELHNLILSGKTGLTASVLRLLAGICSFVYLVIVKIRDFLYSSGLMKSFAVTQAGLKTTDRTQQTVPVISIGNITVGGTGKTPMVIWLCNFLQNKGIKCAVLTRGYKSAEGKKDEPAILVENCQGATVVVNPDRLAGAIEAVKKHKAQVLIMDDGFQHRRLHREIDIVTIDALRPFGFNKMLPAGLLREPVTSLKRAQAAIITRSNLISQNDLLSLSDTLKRINPNVTVAQSIHEPLFVMSSDNQKIPLEDIKGRKIFAFCGIANPEAFFATLEMAGVKIVARKIYSDHHNYLAKDAEQIRQHAEQAEAEIIITTEKDFNKIRPLLIKSGMPVSYLAVQIKFVYGQELITGLIERGLAGKIRAVND